MVVPLIFIRPGMSGKRQPRFVSRQFLNVSELVRVFRVRYWFSRLAFKDVSVMFFPVDVDAGLLRRCGRIRTGHNNAGAFPRSFDGGSCRRFSLTEPDARRRQQDSADRRHHELESATLRTSRFGVQLISPRDVAGQTGGGGNRRRL